LPIAIEQGILEGKGLTQGDMSEFEDSDNITQDEDGSAGFSMHTFHTGKITVAVYEAEPGKVHIDGAVYDEFVQILEGRLILTPDSGGEFEFKTGESLVVPKGYKGGWHMPEKYRELIVIDTAYLEESGDNS
jgi:uncharacterized cupin superfamily protein